MSAKLSLMTLDLLKQDLFERFIRAFDEFDRIAEKKATAQTFVYSQLPRYSVHKFDGKKIPAGGKTLPAPPESNPQAYGLDTEGQPCYHSSEHTWNQEYWEGFYNITDACIEYIEFSLQSKMPVEMSRILLNNGRKIGFQHLRVNGGWLRYAYNGLSNREIVEQLKHDSFKLISTAELYHYEGQRIVSADCWNAMPGMDSSTYKQKYRYNIFGKLKDIFAKRPDNTTQYIYADIPEEVTLEELSDQVAREMANAIADTLQLIEFPSPLAIMELSYQEIGNYAPYIGVVLQKGKENAVKTMKGDALFAELFLGMKDEVEIDHQRYERLLTAFINRVMDDENFDLATAMIRKVANLLTTQKAFGKAPVTDDFIAYAIDWSIAPENVTEIMRECGMSEEALERWKMLGVFGEEY